MRNRLLSLLVVLLTALSTQAWAAQEPEFRLKTYGMVCNQCAYGVEQSLQHTKGVKDAIVDLKSGNVVVKADPSNPPSAEILAQRIKDQRVSIKAMEAILVGRIVRSGDGWQLVADSRRFDLEASNGVRLDQYEEQTVTIQGIFKGVPGVDGAEGPPRLAVGAVTAG